MNVFSNKIALGIGAGALLAFFVTFGGWAGLVWLLLFSAVGGAIGAHLEGKLDIAEILSTTSGRGRS
ncbi:hypothetical protein CAPI_01345 [Corynebacterium capitovis DSM 44611]|uniref:hypothetical protein n=1 Tax=Corynebacterium capitovis TaxID=131081 RepID=UPI00037DF9E1|nr:hypothetical protein [Corynebacterium capitovis]WKD56843.1 hypothetical protein CAPI_01345 [Corynebacterium capitovis DSM 44611]